MKLGKVIVIIFLVLLIFFFQNIDLFIEDAYAPEENTESKTEIHEDQSYTDPYEVARYIFKYDKLPPNYITKQEAIELGWLSHEGNLWEVTDEKSIGGNRFYNREGDLPESQGRVYYECDVNYQGGYRGSERLVYSNDGLIFYTKDHYDSFKEIKRSN
ncbi:MAG: ribonuclease domain-containing protein [Clostridia bacterium]